MVTDWFELNFREMLECNQWSLGLYFYVGSVNNCKLDRIRMNLEYSLGIESLRGSISDILGYFNDKLLSSFMLGYEQILHSTIICKFAILMNLLQRTHLFFIKYFNTFDNGMDFDSV